MLQLSGNAAVASLLEQIQSVGPVTNCGCRNQLYLLIIFPTAIANKTNLQSEFCGGDHDREREVKWLNSSSPTELSVKLLLSLIFMLC